MSKRDANGRWLPGESANPSGRAKENGRVIELARMATEDAINTLTELCKKAKSERTRVAAAVALLDRGYGRPHQSVGIEDSTGRVPNISVSWVDPEEGNDGND